MAREDLLPIQVVRQGTRQSGLCCTEQPWHCSAQQPALPSSAAGSAAGWVCSRSMRVQVPSACFVQPPLAYVGCTEEEAIGQYSGDIDVYVSKFKPMKNTVSGRDERTLMKLLVHAASDQVMPPCCGCAFCGREMMRHARPA